MTEFEKQAMKILDEYLKQAGIYPDSEEFAHIISVRLGKTISRSEAEELIKEHYKEQLLKWAGEELAKYDFIRFYEAMYKVIEALNMLFYETKNPKWGFRAVELEMIFTPFLTLLEKEDLMDKIEAQAIMDEHSELMMHPKPFKEFMTPEELDDYMSEVQHGINMLTEYYRGMGNNIVAMAVTSSYFPVVGIFRSIREDLGI